MSNDFGSYPGDASRNPGHGAPQQPYGQQYGQQQYGQQPPSYGYAPPGYGAPQGPPPPSGKIKPSIGWIVGVWLLALVSIVVGIGGFAGGLFNAVTDAAPTQTFAPGQAATVKIDPADKPAIYVATGGPTQFECTLKGGTGTPSLQKPDIQQTVAGSDGVTWEMGLRVGVDQAGDYQVQCSADPAEGTTFGVGKELAADSLVGGVLALFLIPAIGILLAIVVTIVVLVRRSGARKRRAAAVPVGQWGQPGPYGG
ncbi:hypothetical protein [Streptosporangium sp. NPDC002721]|uniref:hypothetical protein n=1 Tax=Streptosporangium sp. NPDC002721 TaxID=3366188 RepID=UPI00369A95A0